MEVMADGDTAVTELVGDNGHGSTEIPDVPANDSTKNELANVMENLIPDDIEQMITAKQKFIEDVLLGDEENQEMIPDQDGCHTPSLSAWSCRKFEGSVSQVNEYEGYEPPSGITRCVERITSQISPKEFYENYVMKRRPVVLSGTLMDADWHAEAWTNRYLAERAGKAIVRVEKRHTDTSSTRGTFGTKEDMPYFRFLQELDKGNESLYMTTQDLERDEGDLDDFGMPQAVAGEPLRCLKEDFPVRPALLGNLIPYQVSLWQGASRNGASSGLHHDFHDNLYILMRGRKTFRLFPPSAAGVLKPGGTITKIHKNGLIVYAFRDKVNVVNIRADGVPLAFLARRKREEAETELAEAEDDLEELREQDGGNAARARRASVEKRRLRSVIGECEDRIDEAIAEAIRYGDVSDDEDEVISISDSDDDDEAVKQSAAEKKRADEARKSKAGEASVEGNFSTIALPPADVADEDLTRFLAEIFDKEVSQRKATELTNHNDASAAESTNHVDENKTETEICSSTSNGDADAAVVDENSSKDNNGCSSNSKMKNSSNATNLSRTVELPESLGCLIVDLKPNEMLYLPASWFHEVTSYNDDDEISDASNGGDSVEQGNKDNVETSGTADVSSGEATGEDSHDKNKEQVGEMSDSKQDSNKDQNGVGKSESDGKPQRKRDRGHLALNYWVYPPDGSEFERPYVGEFWPRRWYELETLNCTMGLGGRRNKKEERGRGECKHVGANANVITLDSDDEENEDDDDEINGMEDSDCFPTERHISDDEFDDDDELWDVATRKRKRPNVSQTSHVTLNDSSSLCEIVGEDDDDDYDDDDEMMGESELDSSAVGSYEDLESSRKRFKPNSGVPRGRDVAANEIYVDLDSDNSQDVVKNSNKSNVVDAVECMTSTDAPLQTVEAAGNSEGNKPASSVVDCESSVQAVEKGSERIVQSTSVTDVSVSETNNAKSSDNTIGDELNEKNLLDDVDDDKLLEEDNLLDAGDDNVDDAALDDGLLD